MVAITRDGPRLEGVFGPLTPTQDRTIREAFATISADLVKLAARLGSRAGWEGSGLELNWMRSGQTSIECFVEGTDSGGHGVSFLIELRPSWYYGLQTGRAEWEIEMSVETDCRHDADHGPHTVFEQTSTATNPEEAVNALRDAATLLVDLATKQPLSRWTDQGQA
jgi:hypothetical protein